MTLQIIDLKDTYHLTQNSFLQEIISVQLVLWQEISLCHVTVSHGMTEAYLSIANMDFPFNTIP